MKARWQVSVGNKTIDLLCLVCFGKKWVFAKYPDVQVIVLGIRFELIMEPTSFFLLLTVQLPWKGCAQLPSFTTILVAQVVRAGL